MAQGLFQAVEAGNLAEVKRVIDVTGVLPTTKTEVASSVVLASLI